MSRGTHQLPLPRNLTRCPLSAILDSMRLVLDERVLFYPNITKY